MDECFMCAEPASNQFTLRVSSKTYQNKSLCETCATNLNETDWIAIHPAEQISQREQ